LPLSLYLSGLGMQSIMLGLIAELLMRTYHESQGKAPYVIKKVFSLPRTDVNDLAGEMSEGQVYAKGV
jgi:hypothetical protein